MVAAAAPLLSAGQLRLWQYTDGRKFTAEFQWASKETLYLKDKKGKEFEIPIGSLSNRDLEYVRGLRNRLLAKGITYTVPLTWEEYRSRNFTASEAQKAGYFPLDSSSTGGGTLRLEFRRFGPPPKLSPNQKVVLRMKTSSSSHSGTLSTLSVTFGGRVIGALANVPSNSTFDIPLSPLVLQGREKVNIDLRCGADTVFVRTRKSGSGPRLLIIEQNPG
jgi:hypothetical protein